MSNSPNVHFSSSANVTVLPRKIMLAVACFSVRLVAGLRSAFILQLEVGCPTSFFPAWSLRLLRPCLPLPCHARCPGPAIQPRPAPPGRVPYAQARQAPRGTSRDGLDVRAVGGAQSAPCIEARGAACSRGRARRQAGLGAVAHLPTTLRAEGRARGHRPLLSPPLLAARATEG